ncbi:SHOCT domain-containing protein [Kitasatospora sp. NBC_01287]|nr:SHOCT domain-containing protein [Kitasatospora sp. NBC_01287]
MNATTATALLADDHWHGGPWFLFFPLLWFAFLAFVFVTLRRTAWRRGRFGPTGPAGRFGAAGPTGRTGPWSHGGPQAASQSSPLTLLAERFARGEIDEDEYWARRATLNAGEEERGGSR